MSGNARLADRYGESDVRVCVGFGAAVTLPAVSGQSR